MSQQELIEANQEEINKESEKVQDAMMKSQTGKMLLEASQQMAQSQQMVVLMQTIDEGDVGDEDKFLMGKYMGQLLQEDPENGLENYSEYLKDISEDPDYASRKEYFLNVANKSLELNSSPEFKDYVEKYNQFEEDESDEAEFAREAMNKMSEKMRELIGEEEDDIDETLN